MKNKINTTDDFNICSIADALDALLLDTENAISLLANAASLMYHSIDDINWLGFYILNYDTLYLGPFQGKPACIKIPITKGVCGRCVMDDNIVIVDNVHTFLGHISCDDKSNSEVVFPIHLNNKIYAVLDIDSPIFSRFSNDDIKYLKEAVIVIEKHLNKLTQA